jgi:hypothetical protein
MAAIYWHLTDLPILHNHVRLAWQTRNQLNLLSISADETHMRHWMARLVALRSAVLEIFSFETYSTAQNLAIDQTTSGFEHGAFGEAAACYPAKIEF